jgi:DHA2 family multidrug resistance protein-like MFS transporter
MFERLRVPAVPRAYGVYGAYGALGTYWLFAMAVLAAAPAMALGLGLSRQTANTAVGLAALFCGMLVWPARKAAAQLGALRLAQAGLVVFIAGAVLAGAAPNGAVLLVGRALQGASGAMVLPYVAWPAPAMIGMWAVAGPAALLGGALTSALDWQWVFWLSLIVAGAALALISLAPPEPDNAAAATRSVQSVQVENEHYTPLILLVPGLLALYAVLNQASGWDWSSARSLILIAVAVFALALFVRWEREHAEDPQLDPSPSPAAVFLLHFAVIAALYVFLTYLQAPDDGRGLPAVVAGLLALPLTAGALAVHFYGNRLPALPPMAGAALAVLGLVLTALTGLGSAAYYPLAVIGLAMTGAGLALGVRIADPHPAAGQLGAAFGIAVTGAVTSGILTPNPTALGRATATALLVSAVVAALSVFVAAYTATSVGSRAE